MVSGIIRLGESSVVSITFLHLEIILCRRVIVQHRFWFKIYYLLTLYSNNDFCLALVVSIKAINILILKKRIKVVFRDIFPRFNAPTHF